MSGIGKLVRRGSFAFKRRYVARALILIYHRIAEDSADPWRLCVSPANFARQMETIRKLGFTPVHVSALAQALRARQLPRRTIAVAFDDGYRDNLENARPILERYDMPMTHYATAGYIGSDQPFWWDALDFIFLRTELLPQKLNIALEGKEHAWDLGEDAAMAKGQNASWPEWKPFRPSPTRRHQAHDELWRLLVSSLPKERDRIVRQLIGWSGLDAAAWAQARPMSEDELRALRGDGLVEIGGHSLTHPALSALPATAQAHELRESKARLERILGSEVRGCSYPQGGSSPEVQNAARNAGYDHACGSLPAAVGWRSNLFHLPRHSVRDWGEARFRSLLAHVA